MPLARLLLLHNFESWPFLFAGESEVFLLVDVVKRGLLVPFCARFFFRGCLLAGCELVPLGCGVCVCVCVCVCVWCMVWCACVCVWCVCACVCVYVRERERERERENCLPHLKVIYTYHTTNKLLITLEANSHTIAGKVIQ